MVSMVKVGIIGAGIVGLFSGYYLSKKGYQVTIYEKCDKLGCGSSGHNAGVMHLIQPPFNSIKSYLSRLGYMEYKKLNYIFNYTLKETDLVITAFNRLEKYYLNIVNYILGRNGFNPVKLGSKDLREYEGLSKRAIAGIKVGGYGVVEPLNVLKAISKHLLSNGVEIRFSFDDIDTLEEDYIVVSAGYYSYELGGKFGDIPPKHRFSMGVMVNIDYSVDAIYAYPPNPIKKYTKGGAVIPKTGYTLLGPGFKWVESYEEKPNEHDIKTVYKRFLKILDEETEILSYDYGIRPINLPKDDFIIRKRRNKIFLYGIDSPGFTAAPLLGKIVSNLISYGEKWFEVNKKDLDILVKED